MKLSKNTVTVLRNFAAINQNIMLHPGNKISTISIEETLLGYAEVEDEFPIEMGIYDLSEFLSALALFEDPDLEFERGMVRIKSGKHQLKYVGAEPAVLKLPTMDGNSPSIIKKFPICEIQFKLPAEQIAMILKTASVLKSPDLTIEGDGENINITIADKKNSAANSFDFKVGESNQIFKAYMKIGNMRMLPGDYDVFISARRVSKWECTTAKITYFVGLDSDSTFDL